VGAVAEDGPEWVRKLAGEMSIPGLSAYGIQERHFSDLAGKASRSSSMKGNPLALTAVELARVLQTSR
jgi:alcohol dehydrogenase class IV